MNILVSCNDAYMMPMTVFLQSLFDTQTEPVDLYFMWSEVSE